MSINTPITSRRSIINAPLSTAKSAYRLWLDAGNAGSTADFLASLKGEQGIPGAAAIVNLSVDPALGTSDILAPSQAAVKSYVDAETSRATQAEVALGSAISQEGLDRASALSAVQARVGDIEGLLTSDDVTLDQLQEIVDYIKANRSDLDAIGIGGVYGLSSALAALEDSIAVEVLRASDAEALLITALGEETSRAARQVRRARSRTG